MKLLLACSAALALSVPAPAQLLGRWRVIGCATSPGDPASCAKGEIVFDADRWSVELPCCHAARAYTVDAVTAHDVAITSDGLRSDIRFAGDGTATWNPHVGDGRVGALTFVRAVP